LSIIAWRWNGNTLIANGEIVLVRKLYHIVFFFQIVKIEFKNGSSKLFFEECALFAQKTRFSIIVSWIIHIKWFKAFHIEKKHFLWQIKYQNFNFMPYLTTFGLFNEFLTKYLEIFLKNNIQRSLDVCIDLRMFCIVSWWPLFLLLILDFWKSRSS